ncbi:hypothetical protein [Sphingomonas sp. PAMC 26621]|nr:hypothetical protein [Sphingomonas sp. PAMC 26621]
MRWVGSDVRQPIEAIAGAFPDMHRELLRFHLGALNNLNAAVKR